MKNAAYINKLFEAAYNESITFSDYPLEPIGIGNTSDMDPITVMHILDRYKRHGFAVVELKFEQLNSETILGFGMSLGLGEPFIPPLYLEGNYKSSGRGVSKISVQLEDQEAKHPSFEKAIGLKFHADGTLQKIGYVKTTVMFCESPGAEGGDTILFNASAAFAELFIRDKAAALSLIHPEVLVRQANMNGCSDINKGPAFSVENGQIISAYSVTETDSLVAVGNDENNLARAREFLYSASQPGSPYFTQLKLTKDQGIILANAKIAHGRTPFRNTEDLNRCMYRSIYLRHPTLVTTNMAVTG